MKTNDEERQKKYEDKISLRSLLLRDIDRINKAHLKRSKTGMDELENLLSDLPEDIYRSVVPEMSKRIEKLNGRMNELNEWRERNVVGCVNLRKKNDRKRKYHSKVLKAKRNYVREVKKVIRWTMDEFGLGLEEEGKRVDKGGLTGS